MRILICSDTPRDGWAIGKLSNAIIEHNQGVNIDFVVVHPREVDRDIVEFKKQLEKKPDIIHFQYWRSTKQLFERIPELKDYKTIQTHHNQKNTLSVDWRELKINQHIVHTEKNKKILEDAGYENVSVIQHGIDLKYFKYFRGYKGDTDYVGMVGRICPWKNNAGIAKATREADLKVLAMGKIDKVGYWESIPIEDRNNIDFLYQNVPDKDRINAYYDMMCFVQNSNDLHEEGTLPLLEAMACGIPVITTLSGEGADIISDGENGLIVSFDNSDALRVKIKMLKEKPELREKLRKNAWQTIKNFTEERMAREYLKAYYKLFRGTETISVITPLYNDLDNLKEIYKSLEKQTYPITEWVIIDDNSREKISELYSFIKDIRENATFTVKYLNTNKDGYNLAMARNMGIIEACGKHLMFLDSRINPEKKAVEEFFDKLLEHKKTWLWGDKGADKRTFVENFSFVKRKDVIIFGMFNERINRYGGISQEIRERWLAQGNNFEYCRKAKSLAMSGSKMTDERRQDIIKSKYKIYKMGL